jgi:hypothetical protein
MPRAVGRYSLWSTISRVSPGRPSTNASASVHATVTTYAIGRSARHGSLAARRPPLHTPRTASATATGVPGPHRASNQPASGANGCSTCRLACTCQPAMDGTATAAPISRIAAAAPIAGARSERDEGTRSG